MSPLARALPLALVLLAVLAGPAAAEPVVVFGGGQGVVRDDPDLPPREVSDLPSLPDTAGGALPCNGVPAPYERKSAPAVPKNGPTVGAAIDRARRANRITEDEARDYRAIYANARTERGRLTGMRRTELSSVIGTLERIARGNRLTASRMPALFLQLRRNTQFWSGEPRFPPREDVPPEPCERASSGPAGARIVFERSQVIWQYYPGRGLQFQPLANFGKANGMYTRCRRTPAECDRDGLRALLDELVAMRSSRGGFVTWEYYFDFGGGAPPWTSGMSQGTAVQALARGSQFLREPSYLRVARSAIGAFEKGPPTGVRVRGEGGGSHYLLYSFSPGLRVLNGFIQSLVGLYDYAKVAEDRRARSLFRAGDRSARREVPRYDTGAWSLYSRGGAESTLGYHDLVQGFLRNLCKRSRADVYCRTARRFSLYMRRPTRVRYLGPGSARAGRAAPVRFRIDKVSCVTLTIRNEAGQQVYRSRIKFARGTRSFNWVPRRGGRHALELEVLDLRRNRNVVNRTVTVRG